MSNITWGEMLFGVEKRIQSNRFAQSLFEFAESAVPVVPLMIDCEKIMPGYVKSWKKEDSPSVKTTFGLPPMP
jgi:hypothetical protein